MREWVTPFPTNLTGRRRRWRCLFLSASLRCPTLWLLTCLMVVKWLLTACLWTRERMRWRIWREVTLCQIRFRRMRILQVGSIDCRWGLLIPAIIK